MCCSNGRQYFQKSFLVLSFRFDENNEFINIVTLDSFFLTTCLEMIFHHKSHETMLSVTPPGNEHVSQRLLAATVAQSIIKFQFSLRSFQEMLHQATPHIIFFATAQQVCETICKKKIMAWYNGALTEAAGKIYIAHTHHILLRARQHFLTEFQVQSI